MKNAVGVSDLDWGRHEAIGNIMDHFSKAPALISAVYDTVKIHCNGRK